MKTSTLAFLLLALGASPAAAQRAPRGERAYVAPTDATIIASEEESFASTRMYLIYVTNRSSVPITVYSASLRNCENVKQSCTPIKMNLRIRPDGRMVILRVQPKNENEGMRYAYTFGWRADSSAIAALQTLASAGSTEAKAQLDANAEAAASQRRQVGAGDIWIDDTALGTLDARIASIRIEPDSMTVREGRAFLLRDVRVMAVDSAGQLIGRLGAGVRWKYQGNAAFITRADTVYGALPGRASITFTLTTPTRQHEKAFPVIVLPDSTP